MHTDHCQIVRSNTFLMCMHDFVLSIWSATQGISIVLCRKEIRKIACRYCTQAERCANMVLSTQATRQPMSHYQSSTKPSGRRHLVVSKVLLCPHGGVDIVTIWWGNTSHLLAAQHLRWGALFLRPAGETRWATAGWLPLKITS